MPRPRKPVRVLCVGLDMPSESVSPDEEWTLHSLIRVIPRALDSFSLEILKKHLDDYTHIIFTSKSTVRIFAELIGDRKIFSTLIAVGKATADEIMKHQWPNPLVPDVETSEGVVELLETLDLSQAFVLWPHSALSRPVLYDYFRSKNIKFHFPILYDTTTQIPEMLADLSQYDALYFTSPSSIDAFFEIYGKPPQHLQLRTIGQVTEGYLQSRLAKF